MVRKLGTAKGETLYGTALIDSLYGLGGNDTLYGLAGIDKLFGGEGADKLYAGAGNDSLDGGLGNDVMMGGLGNDVYIVNAVGDKVIETAGQGSDLVKSGVNWTLGVNVENLTLTGTAKINGTGNALANTITGNAANNVLVGGAGFDKLVGGAGSDIFQFRSVNDSPLHSVTEPFTAKADLIADFHQGEDRIDLSTIDPDLADSTSLDLYDFRFIGSQIFTNRLFGNPPFFAEISSFIDSTRHETRVFVNIIKTAPEAQGSDWVNRDTVPDMVLALKGAFTLTNADFIL